MSEKKNQSQSDGVKPIPDPEKKSVWWYLSKDRMNTRLPLPLDTKDVVEDQCNCNCDILRETIALDLVKFILSSEELSTQIPAPPPFLRELEEMIGMPITPEIESPETARFKTQLGIGLSTLTLCKEKCPELTMEDVWIRTEELLEDEFISNELQTAYVEGMTDEASLKNELEAIKNITKTELAKYQTYGTVLKRIGRALEK